MNRLPLLLLAVGLTACTDDYARFYKPVHGVTPEKIAELRVSPPPAVPAVDHTSNPAGVAAVVRHGYGVIGISVFNSGHRESEQSAIEQGQKVGADLVLIVDPRYTGTVSGQIPVDVPTVETSVSRGSATAFGNGRSATAYGTSTTTTYGTKTENVPFAVNRFEYAAVFFFKNHYHLGANYRNLTDQERAAIQSNSGVYVTSVVDGSPAFTNDILVGDIITRINGKPASTTDEATRISRANAGRTITLTILRNGRSLEKAIHLLN